LHQNLGKFQESGNQPVFINFIDSSQGLSLSRAGRRDVKAVQRFISAPASAVEKLSSQCCVTACRGKKKKKLFLASRELSWQRSMESKNHFQVLPITSWRLVNQSCCLQSLYRCSTILNPVP